MENKEPLVNILYDLYTGQISIDKITSDPDLEKNMARYEYMADRLIEVKNDLLNKLPDTLLDKYGTICELDEMVELCDDISRHAFRFAYQYGLRAGLGLSSPL